MKKKFICAVCGYIYEGDAAPEKCPICKAPASKPTLPSTRLATASPRVSQKR